MIKGKKTYIVAIAMIVHAVSGYLLGDGTPLDVNEIMTALGIMALRSGVKNDTNNN